MLEDNSSVFIPQGGYNFIANDSHGLSVFAQGQLQNSVQVEKALFSCGGNILVLPPYFYPIHEVCVLVGKIYINSPRLVSPLTCECLTQRRRGRTVMRTNLDVIV